MTINDANIRNTFIWAALVGCSTTLVGQMGGRKKDTSGETGRRQEFEHPSAGQTDTQTDRQTDT
jgi:hypothetical protein